MTSKFIPELSTTSKETSPYVNNAEMLAAIVQYRKECRAAKRDKLPKPRIPDSIGKQLYLIAENLSHKNNFSQYTFREDMIGDAVENCLMYFDNFNPKRSKYPFAYFTKITYYAFVRRIQKEKKSLYIKYKATQQAGILHDAEYSDEDNPGEQFEMYDNINEFIAKFEEAQEKAKEKKKLAAPKKKKQGLELVRSLDSLDNIEEEIDS
jgi:elongation factor P--beta-lysine ligase